MKKLVISSLLFLLCGSSLWAQDQDTDGNLRQRLEAMKVAFITEKIGLSPEQAQAFWPMYNAYQDDQKAVRQKYRAGKSIQQMSDAELEKHLRNSLEQEAELLELKRSFFEKAQQAINIRQIALLRQAEQEFNKEVLRRVMERQQNARRRRIENN